MGAAKLVPDKDRVKINFFFSLGINFIFSFWVWQWMQHAKKGVSDSPGLVDFAIRLVNSVIKLPDGQVKLFEEFKLQKNCEINLLVKTFLGLVELMLGLVNVSFSLPEWQAVKMIFFAPWNDNEIETIENKNLNQV